ncbi:MAG TPA: hypothetical protein VN756_00740, partial [Solirubrobacterales bacterium]|nr:hypothetical protein [Solirubrobacterales bacterium]
MVLVGRTRLRSLKRHFDYVTPGEPVVIGLTDLVEHREDLLAAGFAAEPEPGERLLPTAIGPASTFNAEGDWKVHRDRPMETAYREINWEWQLWDGTWMSDTCYQPYQRYPRTRIEAPAVELEVQRDPGGIPLLTVDPLDFVASNEVALLHRINLFRELFGEAAVLTEDLGHYVRVETRQLNWELLPPGEMPWPQLQTHVKPLIDAMGERKGPVATRRLKVLTQEFQPDVVAVGRAGFSGYLAFGYGEVYVMESLYYGNATYVFGSDWEELSKLSK